MNERKITIGEVEQIVEKVLSEEKCDATISSVEPNSDGDYCTVILEGDVWLNTLKAIAKAVGDEPIVCGEKYNKLSLFFHIPDEDKVGTGDDDDDDHDEPEENAAPSIPDRMRHKERFYDSEDVVIPGTESWYGTTNQNERIMAYVKKTGHYPIMYIQLDDGLHVEVSDIYDSKVRDILERGWAVGGDGRKYKIENPGNVFPIGQSLCVRATCVATGRNDAYGLDFLA